MSKIDIDPKDEKDFHGFLKGMAAAKTPSTESTEPVELDVPKPDSSFQRLSAIDMLNKVLTPLHHAKAVALYYRHSGNLIKLDAPETVGTEQAAHFINLQLTDDYAIVPVVDYINGMSVVAYVLTFDDFELVAVYDTKYDARNINVLLGMSHGYTPRPQTQS